MTNSGEELKWIAKKGFGNDWAIYIHWAHKSEEWIERHGDKVRSEDNIKKLTPCDKAVFEKYRF